MTRRTAEKRRLLARDFNVSKKMARHIGYKIEISHKAIVCNKCNQQIVFKWPKKGLKTIRDYKTGEMKIQITKPIKTMCGCKNS